LTAEVNATGLHQLAATCRDLAAGLPAAGPPAPPTAGYQPSAATAAAIHRDTAAADGRFAARLGDTAALLARAATGFTGTDEDNAGRIAAVAPQP